MQLCLHLEKEMRDLKIICNKWIPVKGFSAMTVFGTIFRREKYCGRPISQRTMNHEGIHVCQSEDFISNKKDNKFIWFINWIIFYLLYFVEWLIKLICNIFYWKIRSYRSISFEQEAYNNQNNLGYQEVRDRFAWAKYIFKFVLRD